jgi:hypothetical protein
MVRGQHALFLCTVLNNGLAVAGLRKDTKLFTPKKHWTALLLDPAVTVASVSPMYYRCTMTDVPDFHIVDMPYEIREERLFPGRVCFVRPSVRF